MQLSRSSLRRWGNVCCLHNGAATVDTANPVRFLRRDFDGVNHFQLQNYSFRFEWNAHSLAHKTLTRLSNMLWISVRRAKCFFASSGGDFSFSVATKNLRTRCGLPQKFHSKCNSHTDTAVVPATQKNPTILVYLLFHIFETKVSQQQRPQQKAQWWTMSRRWKQVSHSSPTPQWIPSPILILESNVDSFFRSFFAFLFASLFCCFPLQKRILHRLEKMGFSVRRTAKSAIEEHRKKCNKKNFATFSSSSAEDFCCCLQREGISIKNSFLILLLFRGELREVFRLLLGAWRQLKLKNFCNQSWIVFDAISNRIWVGSSELEWRMCHLNWNFTSCSTSKQTTSLSRIKKFFLPASVSNSRRFFNSSRLSPAQNAKSLFWFRNHHLCWCSFVWSINKCNKIHLWKRFPSTLKAKKETQKTAIRRARERDDCCWPPIWNEGFVCWL